MATLEPEIDKALEDMDLLQLAPSASYVSVTDSWIVQQVINRIEDRLALLRPEDKVKINRGLQTHDTVALDHLRRALLHLDR